MSESDQFRQYADEALLWVAQSKTEKEKQLLFELVLTWTKRRSRPTALGSSAAVRQNREPRKSGPPPRHGNL
jgi:hypothetical protein